ncbi:hypothetical protein GLOTRDRAFT_89616 [Gloeophyllum trabeum ATCC 11539]|uniref:Uncharacterized protein n=1 Tax=Gloeophyllum trabeum (strain ATCC 11539 / FP-39264 / Madison 617) TaxID=670483 RepID=S7RYE4_GLOTA|nr:uncharacterized protein GLOTRDRAFT_89616 [Gloeophyllum trabeum ATCC 11539]EPQ59965.1 hypothetical protein GLOTRDRAFT_89616 [Gloeophyllum trabeum ATCC 11539]
MHSSNTRTRIANATSRFSQEDLEALAALLAPIIRELSPEPQNGYQPRAWRLGAYVPTPPYVANRNTSKNEPPYSTHEPRGLSRPPGPLDHLRLNTQSDPVQVPQEAAIITKREVLEKRYLEESRLIVNSLLNNPHGRWWRGGHTDQLAITDEEAASVVQFTFRPWELFKLDPDPVRRGEVRYRVMRDWQRRPTPNWLEEYPTPETVYLPLMSYFSLLAMREPRVISLGKRYIRNLRDLVWTHPGEWDVVLEYHMAFFEARSEEMRRGVFDGWAKFDGKLLWTARKVAALCAGKRCLSL